MIEKIIRPGNTSGQNEYCSSKCWSDFSPAMRQVCIENFIPITHKGLRELILELRKERKTRTDIANIFGVTAKTIRVWASKVGIQKL
jgi:hypothetical protein